MEYELESMRPNPVWDADAFAESVSTFAALGEDIVVRVWCGDWCSDCRSQLPDFAAGLDAAGIPDDRIRVHSVSKADDGSKVGPAVEEYGVEYVPTVVVERDDEEVARFVETESRPILVHLADELSGHPEDPQATQTDRTN